MKKIIKSFRDLEQQLENNERPLTMFSGGLDSMYLLYQLSLKKDVRPIALCIGLGEKENIEYLKEMANQLSVEFVFLDKVKEFANECVIPSIAAQSYYLNTYPISSSLSRPFLAKIAMDYAKKNNADIILHTANPSQNTLRRFNGALSQLKYDGAYGSVLEKNWISREKKIEDLKKIGITHYANRQHSIDANLWCREFESSDLDNPEKFKWPEELFLWTKRDKIIDINTNVEVTLTFKNGIPTQINGEDLDFVTLTKKLNFLIGSNQIGRYVGLEENGRGEKVQEIREMPAAYILLDAYKRLETATIEAECIIEKTHLEQLWVREAVEGRWFSLLRQSVQKFIDNISKHVTGIITYNVSYKDLKFVSLSAEDPRYIKIRVEDDIINEEGNNNKTIKTAA